MTNGNLQKALLGEIKLLLEPVVAATQSDLSRRQLFEATGWILESITDFPVNELDNRLTQFVAEYQRLENLIENPPETVLELPEALNTADGLFSAIRELHTIMDQSGLEAPPRFDELGKNLVDSLVINYLETWHPTWHNLLVLLTIIRFPEDDPLSGIIVDESGNMIRSPSTRAELRPERITDLLVDPLRLLRAEYLESDGLATSEHAKQTADRLFPRLGALLASLGANVVYGINPAHGLDFGEAGNELGSEMLTAFVDSDLEESSFGVTLTLSAADRGDLGLAIVPFGSFQHSQVLGDWLLASELTASVEAFAVGHHEVTLLAAPGTSSVNVRFEANKLVGSEDTAFLAGSTTGTRLEVGRFRVSGEARFGANDRDYGLLTEAGSAALIVALDDGDGFLRQILPPDGLRTDLDLALGWSNRKGLYFRGSAGLEATLPVHASVLGVISVDSVYLAIRAREDDVHTVVAATATVQLGPVKAAVERFGLEAVFAFPAKGGNLGPADMRLAFKSASGVGLLIDAGSVVGAGHLFFDPEKEQYAGSLQLEFNGIALSAIGLLTTRMPDGSAGFSLLVSISAEDFPPINLGFGFTLNGVGGLLGVNRTVAVEALRAGIKNRSLDSVLFPEDPVRNAPQIVSDLRTVFPPARGRHVFGPMGIIGWGTPTALTIELGLVLEFPQPTRLVALGQFRAMLPSEERPLVRLQMDALGVVDFDKGEASVDATLYDSRLVQYALSGDMALRSRWREDPTFALAVGGLNPRFQPPPGFPTLQRLAVSLTTGNNPRLRLEAYLALTSNTAQLGARLDLYISAASFSIEGYLGFDALFEFSPFQFVADFGGGVTLKWHGRTLLGVQLEMTLAGPSPVHARGKATFKIWKFSKSVSFDKTLGKGEPPPPLPPVDPLPELVQALADGRNWSAQLPGVGRSLVSLRDIPGSTGVLAHPLGELTVRQRMVPLNVEISRYGNTVPSGDRLFTLGVNLPDGDDGNELRPVTDYFAPAQFFEMGDTAKLTRPSFELMDSGVSIGTEGVTYGGKEEPDLMTSTSIEYKTRLVDAQDGFSRDGEPYTPPADVLEELTSLGAAGLSPARRAGRVKYHSPALGVTLGEPLYVVARRDDLTKQSIAGVDGDATAGVSYTAAVEALRRHLADHPGERADLQVVAEHEAAGAVL